MRIVLCTHRFLPRFAGGVEAYTLRLARTLRSLGHQVYILTGEPVNKSDMTVTVREDVYQDIVTIRLEYDYLRRPVSLRAAYYDPLVTSHIQTILQKLRPDIVHATSLSLLMGGAIEAAKSLGLPFIYTASDWVLTCRRGTYVTWDNDICTQKQNVALCTACMRPHTPLETWLDRLWKFVPRQVAVRLLPLAESATGKKADFVQAAESIHFRFDYLPHWTQQIDKFVAPSTYMREMLILNDVPSEKIVVSPYGVDIPMITVSKRPGDQLRCGFIGRITFIKGVHVLLDAFAELPPEQTSLKIYGKADVRSDLYLQQLQQQAARLSHVEFAGYVESAQITNTYQQLDVLIVPSIWPENSPITILEALAHGVPVIASDAKGITDLVEHEQNGLLFATDNAQDLVAQLRRCVSSLDLVERLSANSNPVKSIEADTQDLLNLYQEILGKKVVSVPGI